MSKLIKFILSPFIYIITVFKVMKAKKSYDEDKRNAWNSFYSHNKRWIATWYREKGLNSKPPVYYDQRDKKWIKLNRKSRRELK